MKEHSKNNVWLYIKKISRRILRSAHGGGLKPLRKAIAVTTFQTTDMEENIKSYIFVCFKPVPRACVL